MSINGIQIEPADVDTINNTFGSDVKWRLARPGDKGRTPARQAARLVGRGIPRAAGRSLRSTSRFRAQFTFVYWHQAARPPRPWRRRSSPTWAWSICAMLALGMAVTGRPAKTARVLVLAFAALSAWMNYLAAYSASIQSVTVYIMPPIAFAVCTDLAVSTVRRYYFGLEDEASPWITVGRALRAVLRFAAVIVLYVLRLVLDTRTTFRGVRQMVLDAAPLPEIPDEPANVLDIDVPATKKAALLSAYRSHADYGNGARVSQVARDLAPGAGLQWGTARTYLGAELRRLGALHRLTPETEA